MRASYALQPFRLLREDFHSIRKRYVSDWTVFNQLIVASGVYVFFTNLLPGITFASDLFVLTGKSWGTIEVVFSTGLCGIIIALCVPLSLYYRFQIYIPLQSVRLEMQCLFRSARRQCAEGEEDEPVGYKDHSESVKEGNLV